MKTYIESLKKLDQKQLILMLAKQKAAKEAAIAVTGMAMRFPGNINNSQALWQSILDKQVHTGPVPDGRWDASAERLNGHQQALSLGGFVDNIFDFDHQFFQLSEEEAKYTDPQQRVLLSLGYEALSHGNLTRPELAGLRVGVFTAMSSCEFLYPLLTKNPGADDMSPYMGTGSALSASAGRLAFHLGLQGPAMTVDTACSSSLVAIDQAINALRNEQCDIALVGSAHFLLSPLTSVVFDKAQMLSVQGQSRPFDQGADGHVRGEGAGVLLLRRQQDAIKAGDYIHALIKGSAVHQHGPRAQIQASSGVGQEITIKNALKNANVQTHEVSYVEAQGTGSALGGVIEIEALTSAYQRQSASAAPLYVGSAKANFGHMETVSGMLSVIKSIEILKRQQIPPQANFEQGDSRVNWHNTKVQVNCQLTDLPKEAKVAVSSFGFTGTNAHLILQGYCNNPSDSQNLDTAKPSVNLSRYPLVLSAHCPQMLLELAKRMLQFVEQNDDLDIQRFCYSLALGRDTYPHRFAGVVNSMSQVKQQLSDFIAGDNSTGAACSESGFNLQQFLEGQDKNVDFSLYFKQGLQKLALPVYPLKSKLCRLEDNSFN